MKRFSLNIQHLYWERRGVQISATDFDLEHLTVTVLDTTYSSSYRLFKTPIFRRVHSVFMFRRNILRWAQYKEFLSVSIMFIDKGQVDG
jgi:hypothetical protein